MFTLSTGGKWTFVKLGKTYYRMTSCCAFSLYNSSEHLARTTKYTSGKRTATIKQAEYQLWFDKLGNELPHLTSLKMGFLHPRQ